MLLKIEIIILYIISINVNMIYIRTIQDLNNITKNDIEL